MPDIELTPYAPMLIESTRAIGYSLKSAIADIIDNSISANAKNVQIEYESTVEPYIAILDDGHGMEADVLTESMRYGSNDPTATRDEHDLGRYGLGMKTASLSQCRRLTVASKSKDTVSARCWDLDYIKQTGKWSLSVVNGERLQSLPMYKQLHTQTSGTLVVWQRLDRVFAGEMDSEQALTDKMDEVNQHLALVFHRFLPGGDVSNHVRISMNRDPLTGFDPFFVSKSQPLMDMERIEVPQHNSVVTVWPVVLPHPSKMTQLELEKYGGKDGLRSLQGFYVYRNKRLLIWGTWFRMTKMDEFSKLARVRIDIPNTLDALWTLDVKKSTAIPPEIVKVRLKQILGKIVEGSKRTYTFRGKKETKDDITHVWNVLETREGVRYELNDEYPVYEKLSEMISDEAKQLLDEYVNSIAANFPINRLHNDIFNEKKIARDSSSSELATIQQQLQILLRSAETAEQKEELLTKLLVCEPFCNYKEEMSTYIEEVRK